MLRLKQLAILMTLVGVSWFQVVAAADTRQWTGEPCTLGYATPESDDIAIVFRCVPDSREIAVSFGYEPTTAKEGDVITFDLTSEAGSISLSGKGERLLLDDMFLVEGQTDQTRLLHRILAEGKTLTLTVEDGQLEFPLAGSAGALKKTRGLFPDCEEDRRPVPKLPPEK